MVDVGNILYDIVSVYFYVLVLEIIVFKQNL